MTPQQAQEDLDKIMGQIFGFKNPFTLEQFMQKFAFDVRLPLMVNDSTTGEPTWAQSINPVKFITMTNAQKRVQVDDWMLPKRDFNTIEDVLEAWNEVNYTATERQIEAENVAESDNIYNSEYIFRSQDLHFSKHALFSDSAHYLEYAAAIQRSNNISYSARVEDSKDCASSFSISWSGKVTNSMFIHNSYDVYECLFSSHIAGKKFCVANTQLTEEEYYKVKEQVIRWILSQ